MFLNKITTGLPINSMLFFQNNVRLPEGMSVYNAYENNLYWYILKTKEKT
jgi:hypothetical protein